MRVCQYGINQLPWLISETIHFYPPIHQDPMVESLVILTMIISCKLSTKMIIKSHHESLSVRYQCAYCFPN